MAALQADKQRLAREGTQMARALREAMQTRKQAQAEVAAARAALQQAQAVAWTEGIHIGEPGCAATWTVWPGALASRWVSLGSDGLQTPASGLFAAGGTGCRRELEPDL